MSFRLFVYYCAVCGAWAAFVGWLRNEGAGGAGRKVLNGVLGGGVVCLIGAVLFILLGVGLGKMFGRASHEIYSSSAWGMVVLGACIGLFIGLAQVILKEAWV